MTNKISIKESTIDEVLKINSTIIEFDEKYQKDYFEDRYKGKKKLIIVAYVNGNPAWFIVWYDKSSDSSFYCWMVWVNPKFRKLGVLSALMEYENDWAIANNYNKIKIKTRNSRRGMLSYLVKNGFYFTEVTQKPNVYDNEIYLEKDL